MSILDKLYHYLNPIPQEVSLKLMKIRVEVEDQEFSKAPTDTSYMGRFRQLAEFVSLYGRYCYRQGHYDGFVEASMEKEPVCPVCHGPNPCDGEMCASCKAAYT